jgi:hypothetical protein
MVIVRRSNLRLTPVDRVGGEKTAHIAKRARIARTMSRNHHSAMIVWRSGDG